MDNTTRTTLRIPEGSYPLPSPSNASRIEQCPGEGCNPTGEAACIYAIDEGEIICGEAESICATGYEGRLCSECDEGYFRHLESCFKCDDTLTNVFVLVLVISWLGVIIGTSLGAHVFHLMAELLVCFFPPGGLLRGCAQ